jgi:hypothetical protein
MVMLGKSNEAKKIVVVMKEAKKIVDVMKETKKIVAMKEELAHLGQSFFHSN